MLACRPLRLAALLIFSLALVPGAAVLAGKLTDAVRARDVAQVRSLLAAGEDVDEKVQRDYPINVAAAYGPAEMVAVLLEAGADVEQSGHDGLHPLHSAVFSGRKDVVQLLLQKGAAVNAKDRLGRTALVVFAASGGKDLEIPRLLLAAGADPNIDGAKAYDNRSALQATAETGDVALAEMLIAAHADVNHQDIDGWSPLHYAVESGRVEMARLLVASGADVNLKHNLGETPLDYTGTDVAMRQLLIDAGAK